MEFVEHKAAHGTTIEVTADEVLISSEQDALDIMANIGYLYDSNSSPTTRCNWLWWVIFPGIQARV